MSKERLTLYPESCRVVADEARKALRENRIVERIRQKDHTLWKPEPKDIADRLGWLDGPRAMTGRLSEIEAVVAGIRADGYTFALLLGMGGSSLAPEVFRRVFGVAEGFLDLAVLDSTDPGAVLDYTGRLDLRRTLFIVSTKSGGTVETFSFLRYFYNLTCERLGTEDAGRHFIAITDPGSALADVSAARGFRHTFLNDPEIGGRYSALSFFGLFPAALIGMDVRRLLERASVEAEDESLRKNGSGDGGGAFLGALLGEMAKRGRDKLTLAFSPEVEPFGDWIEQLVAESTGKEGKGILPVVGEPLGPPGAYGADGVFVSLRIGDDRAGDEGLRRLAAAGHPVVDLRIVDRYDLGGQCFFWEMATVAASWQLAINPFDQPDVEAAKALARRMIAQYGEKGAMQQESPAFKASGVSVYGDVASGAPGAALAEWMGRAEPGAYAAIQAYLRPCPETGAALARLRLRLRDRFRIAVTVGYGPRFLHSTGQLHKGDAGRGLFIQLTADDPRDAPIPDELGRAASALSFGILKAAQAIGDRQALLDADRRVLRLHLHGDVNGCLDRLTETV
ncbi:MAG: glucose-6-phosphate isomerase [Deltaproteobacteria bacterium]|nr:glucose-6-phosphate isomerase [Deltaproteobacteria bacterium]